MLSFSFNNRQTGSQADKQTYLQTKEGGEKGERERVREREKEKENESV